MKLLFLKENYAQQRFYPLFN